MLLTLAPLIQSIDFKLQLNAVPVLSDMQLAFVFCLNSLSNFLCSTYCFYIQILIFDLVTSNLSPLTVIFKVFKNPRVECPRHIPSALSRLIRLPYLHFHYL